MKKTIITFGDRSAVLYIDAKRASLVVEEKRLPVELADALDKVTDMRVDNVRKDEERFGRVMITHNLPVSDLLNEVRNAITFVYHAATIVSNAKGRRG